MTPPPSTPPRSPRWPWLVLAIGLAWTAALRVPLVLHAADHLDSDLAVDGLTLLDATRGHWRWHYPGTPHMGIPPVLLSYPQAMIWGAGPMTLVGGGTVAWLLVVAATFGLSWRGFGPVVACWSIVPLVFSSVGTVWLSGRITGGHLLTLAWHAAALLGMVACLSKGGAGRSALLGLWCGLGIYLDTMFVFTLAGLVPAAIVSWWSRGRSKSGLIAGMVFLLGLAVGAAPREIGRRADPHDPYNEQFAPVFRPDVVAEHARILAMECLPRLIAGVELPGLRASPEALTGNGRPVRLPTARGGPPPFAAFAAVVALGLFVASVVRLTIAATGERSPGRAVATGALLSSSLIVVAFLINRNIFNSDNYRYLIFLLIPWALGFGLLSKSLASRKVLGRTTALVPAALLASAMTASVVSWYVQIGWLGDRLLPSSLGVRSWTLVVPDRPPGGGPSRSRSRYVRIPPGATHVFGDYWDVYRIAFLSGGQVTGVPFPTYPNRFEGWSRGLGPGLGTLVVLDPVPEWRAMLAESWRREGRDPDELGQLSIIIP